MRTNPSALVRTVCSSMSPIESIVAPAHARTIEKHVHAAQPFDQLQKAGGRICGSDIEHRRLYQPGCLGFQLVQQRTPAAGHAHTPATLHQQLCHGTSYARRGTYDNGPLHSTVATRRREPPLLRNSHRQMPCHVPKLSRPPVTGSSRLGPTSTLLAWGRACHRRPPACAGNRGHARAPDGRRPKPDRSVRPGRHSH